MPLRGWLLSRRWQLTVQLLCGIITSALATVVRPIHFPHACLTPVFAVIIIASLAQDQHIGSRLQVTALLLGPTWLAVVLAGCMVSLAKLAQDPNTPWSPQYTAAVSVLSLLGLAVLVTVRAAAPPGPARLMGVLAALMYGIIVLLGVVYNSLVAFWANAVGFVVLAMIVAALVSLLVGVVVAPSLATDEVAALAAEALQGAGAIISYHTSLLMAEKQQQSASRQNRISSATRPATKGDVHVDVRAGPAAAQRPDQKLDCAAQQKDHTHTLWPRHIAHKLQHMPVSQHNHDHLHHQNPTATAAVDAVTAAIAVHRASLEQHEHHRTLDWVVDDPNQAGEGAAAVAAANGLQPQTQSTQRVIGLNNAPDTPSAAAQAVHKGAADRGAGDSTANSTASEQSTGGSREELDDLCSMALPTYSSREHQQQQDPEQLQQQPRLSEQLLQDAALSPSGGDATAAWVAAAATVTASRQASMVPAGSLEPQDSLGPFAAAAAGGGSAGHEMSLDHAASLEFQPEMDDKSFVEMMRSLSRSKPYGSSASLHKLASSSKQPPPSPPPPPPAKSAVSAASTAGSVLGRLSTPVAAAVAAREKQQMDEEQQQSVGLLAVLRSWVTRRSSSSSSSSAADCAAAPSGLDADSADADVGRLRSGRLSSFMRSLGSGSFWLHQKPRQQGSHRHLALTTPQQQQVKRHLQQPALCYALGSMNSCGAGQCADILSTAAAAAAADCGCDDVVAAAGYCCRSSRGSQVQFAEYTTGRAAGSKVDISSALDIPPAAAASGRCTTQQSCPSADTATMPGGSRTQAPPTTAAQLGPIIAAAKAALASARFEPSWLRPSGFAAFDADAWTTLLEDAELLLVRVSTLEALSEERRMQQLHLHNLQHYNNMADAMAITLAQLSAFLADVSQALARQQTNRHVSGGLAARLGWRQKANKHKSRRQQRQQALLGASTPAQQHQQHVPHGTPSPFAAAAAIAGAAAVAGDQSWPPFRPQSAELFEVQSAGQAPSLSAILSGLERQGSGMSSYLWEKKTGWETGRQLLQHEMEAAVGAYWWAVRRASKQAPVKVPGSREVMILTFVYPICTGLIDASERLEASAKRVLVGLQHNSSDASRKCNHTQHSRLNPQPRADVCGQPAQPDSNTLQHRLLWWRECMYCAWQEVMHREQQWLQPLLQLLLVQPGLQAMKQVVLVDLPAVISSRQRFQALLRSRTFQAGCKLYLAAGSALIVTMLMMVYDPKIRSIVPMFGFTSVCLSMQERVEATTDKVVGRVLGTIVGASLGLAIDYIPGVFGSPVVMLACLGLACVLLGVIARAQARIGVALAILTLLSVTLCTYESACCTPGWHMSIVDVFLARMGAVVGACVYVAILNRLLLPWYTSSYAMEQMADALEKAAELFKRIYTSQHNRMRVAAIAAGALLSQDEQLDSPMVRHDVAASFQSCHRATAGATAAEGCRLPMGNHQGTAAAATAELAALEAAEAGLHVALRQEVLSRLIAVQVSLAKESVSWKKGVLATPQVVLDVLGALIECVEALASQRLALAPFTKQQIPAAAGSDGEHGLLRLSGHCYSIWAAPLHSCWIKTLAAVQELTRETALELRKLPAQQGSALRDTSAVQQKLLQLEHCRLELRHTWLTIRRRLHQQVHDAQPQADGATAPYTTQVWPTDSIHFFTFTYGASRVLNKLAAVSHAAVSGDQHCQLPAQHAQLGQ